MGSLIIVCSHYHQHHHFFFLNPCSACIFSDSLSWGVHTHRPMLTEEMLDAEYSAFLKDECKIHMLIQTFLLPQRLHHPITIPPFLSHTYALPILLHPIHLLSPLISECCLPFSPFWRMNGLVSGAILCPSRRSGVCAASHWSSK